MLDIYHIINKCLIKILVELDIDYTNFDIEKNINFLDQTFFYFKSYNIDNLGYKFYNSYDLYIRDFSIYQESFENIIPILFISYPEIYKNGFITYNNNYISIREVLSDIESSNIPPINIFLFTEINNLKGQFMGSGEFNIIIDTNSYFDIYGIYSKDVGAIVSRIFSANVPFRWTNIYINDTSKKDVFKIYLLFEGYNRISDGAILFRDKIKFKLRWCNLFSLQNFRYKTGNLDFTNIIAVDQIDDNINKEVFIVNI